MKRSHETTSTSCQWASYIVLVIRGLEKLAVQEMKEKLDIVSLQVLTPQGKDTERGQAAIGKILVETTSSAQMMESLCSIQAYLAYLAHSDTIERMDQITTLCKDANWKEALALWQQHHPTTTTTDRLVYRASAVRDGKHPFKSYSIAGELGELVGQMYPNWSVNLTIYHIEVVCLLIQQHLVMGLALSTKQPFKSRLPAEERTHLVGLNRSSTLRPSTAYNMLQLAQIEPGHIVLDNMCGVATIPVYAAAFHRHILALGGDIAPEAIAEAQENLKPTSMVNICHWDARYLPLRTDSVDRIVVDMPFGMRCGTYRHNTKLFPKILKEMERVLAPDGLAVLLVLSKKLLKQCATKDLVVMEEYDVNIGGLGAALYILKSQRPGPSTHDQSVQSDRHHGH